MTRAPTTKWFHEPFTRFFEQPSSESLRRLLIEHGGEDPKFLATGFAAAISDQLRKSLMGLTLESTSNPAYPKEGFTAFVQRLIEEKKRLIESVLGLR